MQGLSVGGALTNKVRKIQVSIFDECVLNVSKNFVPNKYVVFDDKEPVWMDQSIKQLIKERDLCFSKHQSQRS